MIRWSVAGLATMLALAGSISATMVAAAEPGTVRFAAAIVGALFFVAVVLGFLPPSHDDANAAMVRSILVWASARPPRVWGTAVLCVGLSAAFIVFGPARTASFAISCADAKRVFHPRFPGTGVEECGADHTATFTAWFPAGRASYLSGVACGYATGARQSIRPSGDGDGEHACPMREFTYAILRDQRARTFSWVRSLDGDWIEETRGVFSPFRVVGTSEELIPSDEGRSARSEGEIVERRDDAARMQIFLPLHLGQRQRIYVRDTPDSPWRSLGIIVGIPDVTVAGSKPSNPPEL